MKFFLRFFQLVIIGIAFASIVPHLIPNYWLTDIFSNFKLQYIILLLLVLLPASFFILKKRLYAVGLIILLVLWNSWFIIPLYLQDLATTNTSDGTLSILSINLLASNTNYSEVLKLIREKDPDVVILLELSPQWEEQMQILHSRFPFRQMYPQMNNFGIGVLGKIPMTFLMTDFESKFPPSILTDLQINGKQFQILATHPVPPVGQEMFELRNAQLKEIEELSKLQSANFIVAGDLNTSSYSKHFQELLEKGNLQDSRSGFGIASSWPTDIIIMRTTLDHFLLKGEMQVLERTTERNIGSDHLPIYLKISF